MRSFSKAATAAGMIAALVCGNQAEAAPPGRYQSAASDRYQYSGTEIRGETEVDKALKKCPKVAAITTGIGVAIEMLGRGNSSGNRLPVRGGAGGALVGAAICGAMVASASQRDKERLRAMQLQAVNTGNRQYSSWRTEEGEVVRASVTTSQPVDVTAPKTQEKLKCRRTNTTLSVGTETSDTSDVVCLLGDSWVMADNLSDVGIKKSDIAI